MYVIPPLAKGRGRPSHSIGKRPINALGALLYLQEKDVLVVFLGHDSAGGKAVIEEWKKTFPILASFQWTPPCPIGQKSAHGLAHTYVEYVLQGYGPTVPKNWISRALSWLGVVEPFPQKDLIVWKCPHVLDNCCVARLIRERFVTARSLPAKKKAKKVLTPEEVMMGMEAEADVSDDVVFSDISEGEDSDDEVQEPVTSGPASSTERGGGEGGNERVVSKWRQGMSPAVWEKLISSWGPTEIVCVTPLTFQTGLIYQVLKYNDQRFGLEGCKAILFHPRGALGDIGVAALKQKEIDAKAHGHLADHTLHVALQAYKKTLMAAAKVIQEKHTLNVPRLFKLARRPSEPPAPDAVPEPGTSVVSVRVTEFITIPGNSGDGSHNLPPPSESVEVQQDSDDDGSSPGDILESAVLAKRNKLQAAKHGVSVKTSTAADAGLGLFADVPLNKGTTIPAKGPWFRSEEDLNKYFADIEQESTRSSFMKRVFKINLETQRRPAMVYPRGFLWGVVMELLGPSPMAWVSPSAVHRGLPRPKWVSAQRFKREKERGIVRIIP